MQGTDILEGSLREFFSEADVDENIRKLATKWTKETWQNVQQCDELIIACVVGWEFSRLSLVDKSILRLSVYQMKFCPDIPAKVVINEAIELAKKFSADKSGSFVNGVLDAIFKRLAGRG